MVLRRHLIERILVADPTFLVVLYSELVFPVVHDISLGNINVH